MSRLSVANHARNVVGRTYVYPVVSRRAKGLSVGINLNPNSACNWRCIYCQVPGLVRGKAPPIAVDRLEAELADMLEQIVHGDFMAQNVPEAFRRLNDLALAGNGEPTTSAELRAVIDVIQRQLKRVGLFGKTKVVLITNGSMTHRWDVQASLRQLATMNGQVWFKLDRVTGDGLHRVNSVRMAPEDHLARLRTTAELAPTFVQTCVFLLDGEPPADAELEAYLEALAALVRDGVPLRGVQLYGIVRQSHQPEASRLEPLAVEWLHGFGQRVRALGLPVHVSP